MSKPAYGVPDKAIDIGHDHKIMYYGWFPDRALNPQYAHLPDVEKFGVQVYHKAPDGTDCVGAVDFDGPVQRELEKDPSHLWKVEQEDPLTLSPSLLCDCGDHGFIREGKWVPA